MRALGVREGDWARVALAFWFNNSSIARHSTAQHFDPTYLHARALALDALDVLVHTLHL